MSKLKVIIVDDVRFWLDIICKRVKDHFHDKLEIEGFSSFEKARERLGSSKNFDILITDIYDEEYNMEGLIFTKYTDEIKNRPVIVVTLGEDIVKSTYKNYNVIEVFFKKNWKREEMNFVLAVNDAIKDALKRKRGDGDDDSSSEYTNNYLS